MRIKYTNKFIQYMGLGDPTTCVYQFIFDQDDSCDTAIIQYYIMHGLGLCIKLNSCVVYMLYAWSFSNNIAVQLDIK